MKIKQKVFGISFVENFEDVCYRGTHFIECTEVRKIISDGKRRNDASACYFALRVF